MFRHITVQNLAKVQNLAAAMGDHDEYESGVHRECAARSERRNRSPCHRSTFSGADRMLTHKTKIKQPLTKS
jgi:hypothetical protein